MILLCCVVFAGFAKAQQFISASTKSADSLFFANEWSHALHAYDAHMADTGIAGNSLFWNRVGFCYQNLGNYSKAIENYKRSELHNPSAALQPVLFSRLAKSFLCMHDRTTALKYFNKAIDAGFVNVADLDTAASFRFVAAEPQFRAIREKVLDNAYPCRKDQHSREFDFWVGEWDAYVTGTNLLAGHSLIQKASGECMILENWTSARSPYEGKSMNYVDPATGKWEQVWVGAEGRVNDNVHRFVNGEYKDSVMRFDFETTDSTGRKLKGRFSFFNQGRGQVRQLNETTADDGKTWSTVYDFTYRRKK